MHLKTKAALVAATATLGLAGTATAASAYTITSSAGGAAVPVGTSFSSSGGALNFQNAGTGAVAATCTGSTLNGVTGDGGSGGVSSQLDVTGGSYTGCVVGGGQRVFVTVNASSASPWSVVPTTGTGSPFGGEVRNVSVTVRCGTATATPATYTGNLTTGVSETNQTNGSKINLTSAGALTKSGSGCQALPATAAVTQENVLTAVGGSPVSAANNLWLNP